MRNLTTLSAHLLYSQDPEDRRYIPDKFGKIGSEIPLPALGGVLLDPNEVDIVRIECAEAIGKIGVGLQYLRGMHKESLDELRRTVIWSLGQIGRPECLVEIAKYHNDPYFMCRKWIPKSLSRIPSKRSEILLHKFSQEEQDERLITEIFRALSTFHTSGYIPDFSMWVDLSNKVMSSNSQSFALLQAFFRYLSHVLEHQNWKEAKAFVRPFISHSLLQLEVVHCFKRNTEFLMKCLEIPLKNETRELILQYLGKRGIIPESFKERDIPPILEGLLESQKPPLATISKYLKKLPDTTRKKLIQLNLSLRNGIDFSEAQEFYKKSLFRSTILRYIPSSGWNAHHFLKHEGLFAEKKIRQIVVEVLTKLVTNGDKSYCDILSLMRRHDKVWHIRRDCRITLEQC